jgi:hypothetical protein
VPYNFDSNTTQTPMFELHVIDQRYQEVLEDRAARRVTNG